MTDIGQYYESKLNQAIGKRNLLQSQLEKQEDENEKLNQRIADIEKAQVFIQQVAQKTQEGIRFHIEDIVQLALDACFPNEYQFEMKFEVERNKTVAKLNFIKNGESVNPMNASGGGVVDIVSFALRLAAWSLSKTASVIVLDEPFRYLSRDLHPKAGEMLKQLSDKLGLQIIMVTHNEDMVEISNKVFVVKMNKEGRSEVKCEESN